MKNATFHAAKKGIPSASESPHWLFHAREKGKEEEEKKSAEVIKQKK